MSRHHAVLLAGLMVATALVPLGTGQGLGIQEMAPQTGLEDAGQPPAADHDHAPGQDHGEDHHQPEGALTGAVAEEQKPHEIPQAQPLAFDALQPEGQCGEDLPTRTFEVVARWVPISYNHWGDFDPHGRIFVLAENEQAMIDQVSQRLTEAGLDTLATALEDPSVQTLEDLGYQFPQGISNIPRLQPFDTSELVRPLILRANIGECVEIELTNKLDQPVGAMVNGVVTEPGQGGAIGKNGPDLTPPGQTRTYTYYIPDAPAMEGAHFLHSPADARYQTRHGLFGALVAEPKGTTWTGMDGSDDTTGPQAIIVDPDGSDHREYVVLYHDEIELIDRSLNPLPVLSPYGEYGPGMKGINLRSEPILDRFQLHDEKERDGELPTGADKSLALSSYTYGDPATFMPQAYLGDPAKFRLVSAGPGQPHVHHLHGGGIRWRLSPVADDTQFDDGLVKPDLDALEHGEEPEAPHHSERVDVQLLSPGESYNAEIEGGAGGVQQSAGDFLFHCHIVEHYLAGMWSFWRVYNTKQDHLAELPDRAGQMPEAVESTELVGTTLPDGSTLDTTAEVERWVEAQLPPPGASDPYDASTWDWSKERTTDGPRYLGEPETDQVWPNYPADAPGRLEAGQRPALQFNPEDGRLAYPILRPHFGHRPPFAPGHGPAPFLGNEVIGEAPDRLCPAQARSLSYNLVAMQGTVPYNDNGDVDEDGMFFAHAQEKAALESGAKDPKSLVLRSNRADCVDVTLTSDLAPDPGSVRKVNIHIHLVQFDMQASDGSIVGFNYETSVRPADETGTGLAQPAAAGATTVQVEAGQELREGTLVGIGLTEDHVEIRRVVDITGSTVTLDAPLEEAHQAAERIGPEFVRYRWFTDVELGSVYFHDHVDGMKTWRHGLYGMLVVEPYKARWLDPHREVQDPAQNPDVLNQHVADIVTPNQAYRELALSFADKSARVGEDPRELATFNLRSAPFDKRTQANPLSSHGHGDPATDTLEAYPGDDVVIRLVYSGQSNSRGVATFGVTGHRFHLEHGLPDTHLRDTLNFGISSQKNIYLACGAGGCAKQPGDYLYYITQPQLFERGAWGLMRVHDQLTSLQPLPGTDPPAPGSLPQGPVRSYEVTALETKVTFNEQANLTDTVQLFAPTDQVEAIHAGELSPTPLVMRAVAGETIEVTVTNDLDEAVTVHPGMVQGTPSDLGLPVGQNQDATVAPGATRTVTWHADEAVGAAYLTSFGQPASHGLSGLYGALVVEPAGSTFDNATGPSATVTLADGTQVAEHVLLYASDDPDFEASVMPYTHDVQGWTSINYRTAPLHDRQGGTVGPITGSGDPISPRGVHTCQVNNDSCETGERKTVRTGVRSPVNPLGQWTPTFGDPETPVLHAKAGQPLVVRALGGAGDQLQAHTMAGHSWARDWEMEGSSLISTVTLGPRSASNAWMVAGPGGPGDYLYGTQRVPFQEAGGWGLLRVS